ncbi:MAG: hypothetical protein ACPGSD_12005 [Flavobacteriales bacterium]|jgi:hypothetical protein
MKSKKESVQDLLLGEFYGICYSAYSNTSFSPEVRAVNVIKEYSSLLESDLNELGENKGNYKTKFINHFTAWMNAKGNCISVMITGGSNFPVRRAEKANASERNKYVAFQNWREKYFKAVNRVPTKSPEEDLIIAERRFEGCLNLQIQMKEINSFCKKNKTMTIKDIINELLHLGYNNSTISLLDEINGVYRIPKFAMANNSQNKNRWKKKMEALQTRIDRKSNWEDIIFEGGRITLEDDRIKIFHDEKPSKEIINEIKTSGFRWSPNWSCWCRKHTGNAMFSLRFLSFLKEK